jgi:hypothetical protein
MSRYQFSETTIHFENQSYGCLRVGISVAKFLAINCQDFGELSRAATINQSLRDGAPAPGTIPCAGKSDCCLGADQIGLLNHDGLLD